MDMDPVGGASTHLLRELQEAVKGLTEEIRNLKEMNVTQARQIWRLNSASGSLVRCSTRI
jgi:hypothetical protein